MSMPASIGARAALRSPALLHGFARRHDRTLVLVAFLLALLLVMTVATVSRRGIARFEDSVRWVDHTHRVIVGLEETISLLRATETDARAYFLTGQRRFLEPLQRSRADVLASVARLRSLTLDNPAQQRQIAELADLVALRLERFEMSLRVLAMADGADRARQPIAQDDGLAMMDAIRMKIDQMQATEERLLVERMQAVQRASDALRRLILVGSLVALLLLIGAFCLLRHEARQRRLSDQRLTQAHRDFRHQAERLETSNRELESFSYSISHDLRIPLRAIDGYAQMMEEDYADRLDDEGRRLLTVIRDNSSRMGTLIDDLLSFSRVGRSTVSAGPLDMNVIVTQVVEALGAPDAEERDLAGIGPVAQVVHVGPLPHAWGDAALIKQVWINLLANALKYSSRCTAPAVDVTGQVRGELAVYSVSDNGVGFDMRYVGKLFGVFQRLHGNSEFPGTGVGLAIVRRIVTRHGGQVWAEGALGQGATFRFSLPCNASAAPLEGMPPETRS